MDLDPDLAAHLTRVAHAIGRALQHGFHPTSDLDRPYACCAEHSLLRYANGRVSESCPRSLEESQLRMRVGWLLRHSPPPYALRVATGFSKTARMVAGLFAHTVDTVSREKTDGTPREHMGFVLQAFAEELAARKMSAAVVLLYSVTDQTDSLEMAAAITALARAAGLPVLDAGPVLRANAVDGRLKSLYAEDQVHFNARGHEVIANWLHTVLPAVLGMKSPGERDAAP